MKRAWSIPLILLVGALAWGAPAGAAVVAAAPSVGGPLLHAPGAAAEAPGLPTVSLNWSGYAATSTKPFNYVQSEFVQPAVSCTGVRHQWTSNWVGFDGFDNGTVEQDGTVGFCPGPSATTPVYLAWYEMYPANSVNVFKVSPGDVMVATARYADGQFMLTIADLSSGRSATHVATCSTCARASAEWIVERPALCDASGSKCFITQLADFRTTTMLGDVARVAGGTAKPATDFTNYSIDIVQPLRKGFTSLDTVGAFHRSTDAFTATWDRPGQTVPISL